MRKLAIITSHPIQYYAPWFAYLNLSQEITLKVFYLWDFGIKASLDPAFKQAICWDIPLLEGYDFEWIPNTSKNPGTSHFWGLQNPSLLKQVKIFNPDVVLIIGYNYASLIRFILTWDKKKAPLLFRGDSHRLVPRKSWQEKVKKKLIQTLFSQFSAFLPVGKANYRYYRYHQVADEKLFFSPHSIDNDRFMSCFEQAKKEAIQWKKELTIPSDNRVILFAGKLYQTKRPLDLLQAFKEANLSKVSLLFVGTGELENILYQQAQSHSNIHFAPFQNQSLMPRTYAIADLFVLPSEGETWGLAVNEAMCLSCPILVSDHVGCAQDLVHSYRNGLVFPAGNVSALTTALQTAFADDQRLHKWGIESKKIIDNYSYRQTTQGLLAAIEAVVK